MQTTTRAILGAAKTTLQSLQKKVTDEVSRRQQSEVEIDTHPPDSNRKLTMLAGYKQLRESVIEAWLAYRYFDFVLKDLWNGPGSKTADMIILEVPQTAARMDGKVYSGPYYRTYLSRTLSHSLDWRTHLTSIQAIPELLRRLEKPVASTSDYANVTTCPVVTTPSNVANTNTCSVAATPSLVTSMSTLSMSDALSPNPGNRVTVV